MIGAVKDLASAIRESAHAEAHPGVYNAVMTLPRFTPDALLSALVERYITKPYHFCCFNGVLVNLEK
ncbi:hypothetical protein ABZP36_028562 [Zizania latifolia]